MKCKILHESAHRMRVHVFKKKMSFEEADRLEGYLLSFDGVTKAVVYERTCDAAVYFDCKREKIIAALSSFSFEKTAVDVPISSKRSLQREFEEKLVIHVAKRFIGKLFFPMFIRHAIILCKGAVYFYKGLRALLKGKLNVDVLDAASITASILMKDFSTAASVMFLLKIGDYLEDWARKKSIDDLASTMALGVDKVWLRAQGTDVLADVTSVNVGDTIIVRTGGVIPLDGVVESGDCLVNQSSMTGESVPVRKTAGDPVFAGTAVEEGECLITVSRECGSGRYDRIIKMIEDSENLKSQAEQKSANMADRLVPVCLGGTILTYLLTRNVARAVSVLMVDFSCALKLTIPITTLYGMNEAGRHSITVKGAKFLEDAAAADTIIFDKTGTLTHACSKVKQVIPFAGYEETELLRMAACMEEHFPHSMASAVVEEAARRGISHAEMHSKINYVVAHGIASEIAGEKVIIGSYHFVFQDEKAEILPEDQEKFDSLPAQYSHLYMAIAGKLACVICIEDPIRSEAADVIKELRSLGINKVVMMTGDSYRIAEAVSDQLGLDEFYAEVLPEDKAAFVDSEKAKGRKVIMVGDGINDSLALSKADVGIAISNGAAIAREIADVMITADDLYGLVTLKKLSSLVMKRVHSNYRTIIGFNFTLMVLGALGILPSATSALLHNASTVALCLHSMTPLLADESSVVHDR